MMSILILWLFLILKGQCDPRKITSPIKLDESGDERVYYCIFHVMVDCLWQRNGVATSIHPYKYLRGNGMHTKDCSIKADRSQSPLNTECAGLITSPTPIKAIEGRSTQLNCLANTTFRCSWRRNDFVVNVDNINRYKYVGNHEGIDVKDCSIIIINTRAIDEGQWKCDRKTNGDDKYADALYGFYSLQLESTTVPDDDHTTSEISPTPTSTSSATESPPNLPLSKEAFAAIIVSSTLFNGIIVAIILVCRRYKLKQRTNTVTHIESKEDEGQLRRELPQPPTTSPSLYYNTEAIALSALRSTDVDGYLVPNFSDKRKIEHSKNSHEDLVKTHVYEKIL